MDLTSESESKMFIVDANTVTFGCEQHDKHICR